MAKNSKFEQYKSEIKYLLNIGISIKSAWKIINHSLPEEAHMSYSAFFHYVKKHLQLNGKKYK